MSHRTRQDRRAGSRPAVPAVMLLLALGAGSAFAEFVPWQGTIGFSLGSYRIADPLFDAVYQPGGSIKGLGLSANIIPHLDFYLDLKMMSKSGELSHSQAKTTFVLLPISLGLRGSLLFAFIRPFAGFGLDYFLFFENNPIGTVANHAKGWHVEAGVYLEFGKNIPILPFAKIRRATVKAAVDDRTIDLGGWEYGAGLAIAF